MYILFSSTIMKISLIRIISLFRKEFVVAMDYRKDYIDVCNVIGGEWSRPATEERLPVYNPSTGEEIGNVPLTPAEEVERAVDVAAEAFTQWRQVDAGRRC